MQTLSGRTMRLVLATFAVTWALAERGVVAQPLPPASRPVAASRPKPADPFAVGSQIEAKWGSTWWSATVVARTDKGAKVKYSDGRDDDVAQADLRPRGVMVSEVKPDFVVKYFSRDARVEYSQGPWWFDGTVAQRDATRALLRDEHGFTRWHDLSEIRSREVAPGGTGTIAPPAAASRPSVGRVPCRRARGTGRRKALGVDMPFGRPKTCRRQTSFGAIHL